MGETLTKAVDLVGAVWGAAVVVVFLGLSYGLPEAGVAVLEKVYAVYLIVGVVWLVRRAIASGEAAQGGRLR